MARWGYSQPQMASEVGLSQQSLSKKLRGVAPIQLEELARICDVMGSKPSNVLSLCETQP